MHSAANTPAAPDQQPRSPADDDPSKPLAPPYTALQVLSSLVFVIAVLGYVATGGFAAVITATAISNRPHLSEDLIPSFCLIVVGLTASGFLHAVSLILLAARDLVQNSFHRAQSFEASSALPAIPVNVPARPQIAVNLSPPALLIAEYDNAPQYRSMQILSRRLFSLAILSYVAAVAWYGFIIAISVERYGPDIQRMIILGSIGFVIACGAVFVHAVSLSLPALRDLVRNSYRDRSKAFLTPASAARPTVSSA